MPHMVIQTLVVVEVVVLPVELLLLVMLVLVGENGFIRCRVLVDLHNQQIMEMPKQTLDPVEVVPITVKRVLMVVPVLLTSPTQPDKYLKT